jgi:tol-pal system-associated acyl-CoA thioesterase
MLPEVFSFSARTRNCRQHYCAGTRRNEIKSRTMQTHDHVLEFRVYLEDTDAQGIVYYANYLRYFERGRSEFLESLGVPMDEVARPDCRLVVYEIRLKFRKPASLGDRLEVVTSMQRASEYRITFRQQVRRRGEDEALVSGEVDVVAIGEDGTLKELPAFLSRT